MEDETLRARLEALVGLETAFFTLLETLKSIPLPAIDPVEHAQEERMRYFCALTAVAGFITSVDKPQGKRFYDLALAFEALNRGHSNPLFEPQKIIDRPQDTPQLWMARARAVLAIEALVRGGKQKPNVAAGIIADGNPRLREFAGSKANKTPLAQVLLNWRKEFQRQHWRGGSARVKTESLQEGPAFYEEGIRKIDRFLAERRRTDVMAIAENVYDDIINRSSVFSLPRTHR
jgi:hypothetical protein